MIRSLTLLVSVFLCGGFILLTTGCEKKPVNDSDIKAQKKNVESEKEKLEALEKRKEVEGKMEADLAALREKIDRLEKQADEATGDEEVELRGEIAKLKTKADQMQKKLDELKAASGDLWSQAKISAEETWKDASESVEKAVSKWSKKRTDNKN